MEFLVGTSMGWPDAPAGAAVAVFLAGRPRDDSGPCIACCASRSASCSYRSPGWLSVGAPAPANSATRPKSCPGRVEAGAGHTGELPAPAGAGRCSAGLGGSVFADRSAGFRVGVGTLKSPACFRRGFNPRRNIYTADLSIALLARPLKHPFPPIGLNFHDYGFVVRFRAWLSQLERFFRFQSRD